jgi:acyl dehydratase
LKTAITSLAQLEAMRGTRVESDWLTVTQDAIDQFADVTRDHQWIHVDPVRAASESPYHTTVAHGFFTLSLLPALLSQCAGFACPMILNYGFDRIRFIGPVPSGSRIRGTFTLEDVLPVGEGTATLTWHAQVAVEAQERPALDATWLQRAYYAPG